MHKPAGRSRSASTRFTIGVNATTRCQLTKRLKDLERENQQLKRLVADQALYILMLKEGGEGTVLSPTTRRRAVRLLQERFAVSERRACRVVGQHRSSQRYKERECAFQARLTKRLHELSRRHPRFGHRRITALLRLEGWRVNRKRVQRVWLLEEPCSRPRIALLSCTRLAAYKVVCAAAYPQRSVLIEFSFKI